MIFKSVVFPEPDGPITAVNPPSSIENEICFKAFIGFIYMFDFKHIRHENPPYGFILVGLGCFHVVPGHLT